MKRTDIPAAWLVAAALVVAACSTTMTGRKQLAFLPDSTMNEMGIAAFSQMKQQGRIEADAATNAYVKCISRNVLNVIPGSTGNRWEVVVFQDPTPNAFALPGGKIGVHTGILQVADTPDRLAAVIGHEIGHVLLRHGNERASQTILAQGAMAAGSVAVANMDPAQQDAILNGMGLGAQLGVLLPYSRKHESEADSVGQDFMAKAGFDPREAVKLWQNMARLSGGEKPPEFMSTHPASQTRIKDLEKGLKKTLPLYQQARREGRVPKCVAATPPATSSESKKPATRTTR